MEQVRAPMPPSKRAKIFSMFDALKGLKEALAAKERIPEERKILAEDAIEELNRTLTELGTGTTIDYIPGLCLRKMTTNSGERLNWQPKQWGYVRMPRAEILSVQDEK